MSPMNANYFLGKVYDPKTRELTDAPVLLDPDTLITHGVVVGMTGSGKTGLCICLLEEAALHKTPAIIIDPKGDLTNLVLHFPNQLASDFEPWIDSNVAVREGKSTTQLAEETAAMWKKGLADWGIGPHELKELKESADFAIYTPGSSSGLQINVLSMLESPDISGIVNQEVRNDRVTSNISALLSMIGFEDADPLQSREHILLSTLLMNAWSKNQSLSLEELIPQIQNPPLSKVGAIPIDIFFPEKDRFAFSLLLNNLLASPSFSIWREGSQLDIDFLMKPSPKPRHSIFCLSHLSDKERMFFVTLLFTSIESWMRQQEGAGTLKGIIYFDEIIGYVPPVANPPSKTVILRLFKQARAYGLGLLLATQNPVDFDYKALSNAGTWIIGRLQTEQDKNRLLDGLTSSSMSTNISEINQLISALPKRVFMMHSIYRSSPTLLHSRWAMNYLPGPISANKIHQANELVDANTGVEQKTNQSTYEGYQNINDQTKIQQQERLNDLISSRPAIPGSIDEYVMPVDPDKSDSGIIYRAGIIAQAETLYLSKQYNLELKEKRCAIIEDIGSGLIHWEDIIRPGIDPKLLKKSTVPNAEFFPIPNWLVDINKHSEIEKDFKAWIYRNGTLTLKANLKLKVFGEVDMSDDEFRAKCKEIVAQRIEDEISKASSTNDNKIAALERKIEIQELDIKAAQSSVNQRRLETLATGGSAIFGMLTGRKRSITSTLSKNRMASAAKDRLASEQETLEHYKEQLVALQQSRENVIQEVTETWNETAEEIIEITIRPTKTNVFTDFFGVIWLPYHIIEKDGQPQEIQAYNVFD